MIEDKKNLTRTAQPIGVEIKRGYGSPPTYGAEWETVWAAKVERIEINRDNRPSRAVVWMPDRRWDDTSAVTIGDRVRIWGEEIVDGAPVRTILFSGFMVRRVMSFAGGDDRGESHERNAFIALDHRWLLSVTSPIYGQYARGPDDYSNYGYDTEAPDDSFVFLSGRRTIFNENGQPNHDPTDAQVDSDGSYLYDMPLFTGRQDATSWTARQMIRYVLAREYNQAYDYLPIDDPAVLIGLEHTDLDRVLNHVVVDGLNVLDALAMICRQVGFGFREQYDSAGIATLAFYKVGAATGAERSDTTPTILHQLHAPAVGENIQAAVAEGRKMLWSMNLDQDATDIVNDPLGIGAPHTLEFTAELVPGWLDSDLVPDSSSSYANVYVPEEDLEDLDDPDAKSFYNKYHTRGANFESNRDVGRRWVLNETGRYSGGSYDRGLPFDFRTVTGSGDGRIMDAQGREVSAIIDQAGKRVYGPFNRQLLACLTSDKESLNSVGIVVEFSFDRGATWQSIPCAINSLPGECGIWIADPNLSEIVDKKNGTITGGDLDGKQLNYWTSLCDDKIDARVFKDGDWFTRIRVTASVQLDQRLRRKLQPSTYSGSPFECTKIFDLGSDYTFTKRMDTSRFDGSGLPAREDDHYDWFEKHLELIQEANADQAVSGQFTLDRLWLGELEICCGDGIERITGREFSLGAAFAGGVVYPEIIQIVIIPDRQVMTLVTRDLRYSLPVGP